MEGLSDDAYVLETAALAALLRSSPRPAAHIADLIEEVGSARAALEQEQGLLAAELTETAAADVRRWIEQGIGPLTVLDPGYPGNLRAVHDRPPLLFISGALAPDDHRAVAVIGSRRASEPGLELAQAVAAEMITHGYTIVSGLAAGIDTAAHITALERGARTIAVIGTGLHRVYPPENAALQRRIAREGAVISPFWPDDGPTKKSFPLRNGVMSGLALATVIVEAGPTSGARIQARLALGHGRPVLLARPVLDQPWAQALAESPGTHVFDTPTDVTGAIERISSLDVPVP